MQNKMDCSTIDKLRQPKIFNMSIFDWVLTFIAAYIISEIFDKELSKVFFFLILLGIVVHVVVGQPTMLNAYLGLADKDQVLKNRKVC